MPRPATTLAFVAAGTERLRLLTSVMVIPHRPSVLTAKMLASADILSKGRVTVGIGVGRMAEEIALLGAPTCGRRGKLADETITAMKVLWTETDPEFTASSSLFPFSLNRTCPAPADLDRR